MSDTLNPYNYANYLFENKHNHDITIQDEDNTIVKKMNKRKSINKQNDVEEGTTTANIAGFQSPRAFGKCANGTPKSLPGFNVVHRKERRPDNADVDGIMNTLSQANESTFIKISKILYNL